MEKKEKVNISDFQAKSGKLIINENLLSNLITKPKGNWIIKNISYIKS